MLTEVAKNFTEFRSIEIAVVVFVVLEKGFLFTCNTFNVILIEIVYLYIYIYILYIYIYIYMFIYK